MSATLQSVVDRIQNDFLNRTDLQAECVRAIKAAIRHYERQRFPWNQTVATLTASAATSTISIPTDFLVLDLLEVQAQSTNYALVTSTFADIRVMNAAPGGTSFPSNFALRGLTFEVSPLPDSAYLINCHYINKLTELTATDMTGANAWLTDAEDVIAYHAAKLIWANTLRNNEEAMKFAQLEQGSLLQLHGFRDQNQFTSIRPTRF